MDLSTADAGAGPAHCANGIKDVDESDIDCGGSCPACAVGKLCLHGTDCDSGACENGKCAAPSCSDGIKNGQETDLDCGGSCPGCADGKVCVKPTDCLSAYCFNNVCKPSLCGDGTKDGDETDIDCGGATCPKCPDGKSCLIGADCQSADCFNNTCRAAAPDMAVPDDLPLQMTGDMVGIMRDDMAMGNGNACIFDDPNSAFDNCTVGP